MKQFFFSGTLFSLKTSEQKKKEENMHFKKTENSMKEKGKGKSRDHSPPELLVQIRARGHRIQDRCFQGEKVRREGTGRM